MNSRLFHSSWRAPEVMTCWENYDEKIDIWSVGCVMAELLLLTRLFPANTQQEHLEQIIDLVGTPDPDTLNRMTDRSTSESYFHHRSSCKSNLSFHFHRHAEVHSGQ